MISFDEPDDFLYRKIKEGLNKLNEPPDPEKLKRQNEELDRIRKELGEEAFQDELLRRFGFR